MSISAQDTMIDYVDWITCPRCRVMRTLDSTEGCDQCRKTPPT